MFQDCGLEADDAAKAAHSTWIRLLKRESTEQAPRPLAGRSIREALVRDPLVSFNRIVGLGDDRLPFVDFERAQLSLVAFATVLDEVGMAPDVALAFAKVMIEAFTPEDLFQPIWEALGGSGTVDLSELGRLDWSPLRAGIPELEAVGVSEAEG